MYRCNICGEDRLQSEMSKRGAGKYATFCKACRNRKQKEKRTNDPSIALKARERDRRWRENNPDAARKSDLKKDEKYKTSNRSEVNRKAREYNKKKRALDPEVERSRAKQYRLNNPDKYHLYEESHRKERSARRKAHYAAEQGRIYKPDKCTHCFESVPLEAHHHDYDKPLEVVWLCRPCHNSVHVRERELARENLEP